jgi:hypothetical protein
MELRFALTYDSEWLEISEPVGFDAFEPELERNDLHGVSVEYSEIDLEFTDCNAIDIIKQKYELSLDSVIEFVVEMNCNDDFDEIYRGRLDLSTYQYLKQKYISVKCKVGQVGIFTTFNNRLDTDVCLDETVSLDGSSMNEYDYINYEITVPGKEIIVVAKCNDNGYDAEYLPIAFTFEGGDLAVICIPGMINAEGDDLGTFNYSSSTILRASQQNEMLPFFELKNNGIEVPYSDFNGTFEFKLRVEANTNVFLSTTFRPNAVLEIYDENGNVIVEYTDTSINAVTTGDNFTEYYYWTYVSFTQKKFRKLYVRIVFRLYVAPGVVYESYSMKVLPNSNSNFTVKTYSILPQSNVKVNLLHEALSRITESITDNGLQVYSDYYGRLDSGKVGEQKMLNTVSDDGLGSLRCLTNGYKLRKYIYTNGDLPRMYLSMKKAANSLAAIDNIGVGFSYETDKWVVRVENWKWFYKNTHLFTIENPANVVRKLNSNDVNTRLHIGYKKYAELSESNVVDTFYSERNYSTLLKAVDKNVNAVSDFVADAYAIEYTRRKSIDKDTKDWSYDEDTFILCILGANITEKLISDGTILKEEFKYMVDNGMTDSDNTIISPETMLNVHISPARNAERWADRMSQYAGANGLRYLSGTRNAGAKGKANIRQNPLIETIDNTIERTTQYRQKSDVQTTENANITLVNPHLKAEILEFDYPISLAQFNQIRLNPYGYILVDDEKCYLKSVKYNFKTSLANFVLIPSAS